MSRSNFGAGFDIRCEIGSMVVSSGRALRLVGPVCNAAGIWAVSHDRRTPARLFPPAQLGHAVARDACPIHHAHPRTMRVMPSPLALSSSSEVNPSTPKPLPPAHRSIKIAATEAAAEARLELAVAEHVVPARRPRGHGPAVARAPGRGRLGGPPRPARPRPVPHRCHDSKNLNMINMLTTSL